jgi:MFS family permease
LRRDDIIDHTIESGRRESGCAGQIVDSPKISLNVTQSVRAAAPSSFPALRHRGYRIYFATSAVAMMADNIEHVISYWVIYERFQSPALAGFAVVSHWVPFLLFSVYSGALADRFDPRRIIQTGMAFFIAASLGWGLLFATGTLEMWHAAVLLIIHGMAGVLWGPASQLLVHAIVGSEVLPSAVRLNATARWLGQLMGPAVGGGLMLALGPARGILANALIYLPLTLWLWRAPYGARSRESAPPAPRAVRGFAEIVATARGIAGNRTIVSMILLAGCGSLVVGNAYQAQMPEFAHDFGHTSADVSYSLLLAADAAGALVAGLVLEARGLLQPRPRTAFMLAMMWCCAIGFFAIASAYPVALALLFTAGFLQLSFNAMAQTLVQLHAPAAIRGRVIGLFNTASLGLRAFGGVTVGLMGALIGVHWSLALSAMVLLAIFIGLLAFTLHSAEGAR